MSKLAAIRTAQKRLAALDSLEAARAFREGRSLYPEVAEAAARRALAEALEAAHNEAVDALARSSSYLGRANAAREAGDRRKAEELDRKAQWWLDRYNALTGDA